MRTTFTHAPWETIHFGCESLQGGAFPTPACSAALQGSRQLVPHSNQNHYGTPRPVAPTLGLHEPGPAFDLSGLAFLLVRFCSPGRIGRWGQTSLEVSGARYREVQFRSLGPKPYQRPVALFFAQIIRLMRKHRGLASSTKEHLVDGGERMSTVVLAKWGFKL